MAGIINNDFAGPFMDWDGVKINFVNYYLLMSEFSFPRFDEHSLSLRRELAFMYDNTPVNFVKATKKYLGTLEFKDKKNML